MSQNYHIPVMLDQVLEVLDIKPKRWYVDCNLGGGGHTAGILERGGNVLGIDLDPDAIAEVSAKHQPEIDQGRLILTQTNFTKINQAVAEHNLQISGVLYDLGVSSHQLESAERGFSFNLNGPLDMRMDPTQGVPAKDLVNALHEGELTKLFSKLGEENFAKPIARKIVEVRKDHLIETADELAQIVLSVRRRTPQDRTHPATRVFQALRIAVNDELNALKESLPIAFDILQPGGRIAVISFHSLEDRIVKNYFKDWVSEDKAILITKDIIIPTDEEVDQNPRARSGKLRAIQKISS